MEGESKGDTNGKGEDSGGRSDKMFLKVLFPDKTWKCATLVDFMPLDYDYPVPCERTARGRREFEITSFATLVLVYENDEERTWGSRRVFVGCGGTLKAAENGQLVLLKWEMDESHRRITRIKRKIEGFSRTLECFDGGLLGKKMELEVESPKLGTREVIKIDLGKVANEMRFLILEYERRQSVEALLTSIGFNIAGAGTLERRWGMVAADLTLTNTIALLSRGLSSLSIGERTFEGTVGAMGAAEAAEVAELNKKRTRGSDVREDGESVEAETKRARGAGLPEA